MSVIIYEIKPLQIYTKKSAFGVTKRKNLDFLWHKDDKKWKYLYRVHKMFHLMSAPLIVVLILESYVFV